MIDLLALASSMDRLALMPVEIRHEDGSLAKHTVLRALMTDLGLQSGNYVIVFEPVKGTSLAKNVTVDADGRIDITPLSGFLEKLSLVVEAATSNGFAELRDMLLPTSEEANSLKNLATVASSYTTNLANQILNGIGNYLPSFLFAGNPVSERPSGPSLQVMQEAASKFEFIRANSDRVTIESDGILERVTPRCSEKIVLQVAGHNLPTEPGLAEQRNPMPLNVMLIPGATALLKKSEHGYSLLRIEYNHFLANQLGVLRHSARVSARNALLRELSEAEIVSVIESSPAAGFRLGYAMLSAGRYEWLDLAKGRLDEKWPDTHIIQAEILAKSERPELAFESALLAAARGLPAFSFGLDALARRLGTYEMMDRAKRGSDASLRPSLRLAHKHSEDISFYLNLVQPFAAMCEYDIGLVSWQADTASVASNESQRQQTNE